MNTNIDADNNKSREINNGLLAYWSFNNQSNVGYDNSGNNNNGINHGANWFSVDNRNALDFERNDGDYMEYLSPIENNPPFSICLWIKPESLPKNMNWVIMSNGGETSHSYGFSFYINNISYSTPQLTFVVKRFDNIGGSVSFPIESNNWIFICGTWNGDNDNNSIKLYINSELTSVSSTNSVIINGPQRNLMIGKDSEGEGSDVDNLWYDGLIDEVRIYNRVLNQNEINYLMINDLYDIPRADFSIRQTSDPSTIEINYVSDRNISVIKWDFDSDQKFDEIFYNKRNVTLYKKYDNPGIYNITLYVNDSNNHNSSWKEIAILRDFKIKSSNDGSFLSYPHPISLLIEPIFNNYFFICSPQLFDHVSFTLNTFSENVSIPSQIENKDVWKATINMNEGNSESFLEIKGFNSLDTEIWCKKIKPNIVYTPDWFKSFLIASDLISDIQVENNNNCNHWSMNIVPAYVGLGYNISDVPLDFIGGKYGINASVSGLESLIINSTSFNSKYYPLISLNIPLWDSNDSWSRPFDFGTFQKAEWYSNILFNTSFGFLLNNEEISCIGSLHLYGAAGVNFDIPVYVIPFISEAGFCGGLEASIDTNYMIGLLDTDGFTLCPKGLSDSKISIKGSAGIYADLLCGFARLEGGLEASGNVKLSLPSMNKKLILYGGAYAKLSALWGCWYDEWKHGFNIEIEEKSNDSFVNRVNEMHENNTSLTSFDLICLRHPNDILNYNRINQNNYVTLANNVVDNSNPKIMSISENNFITIWNDIIYVTNNSFQSDIFWSVYNKTWTESNYFNTSSICEFSPLLCKIGNTDQPGEILLGYVSTNKIVDKNSSMTSFYDNTTINIRILSELFDWSYDYCVINSSFGSIKNFDMICPDNSTLYICFLTSNNSNPFDMKNCSFYVSKHEIVNNSVNFIHSNLLLNNITIENDSIYKPKLCFSSEKIGGIVYNAYNTSNNKYEINMFASNNGLDFSKIKIYENHCKIQFVSCVNLENEIGVFWIENHSKILYKTIKPNENGSVDDWVVNEKILIYEGNGLSDLQVKNNNGSILFIYKKKPSFHPWFIKYNNINNTMSEPFQFYCKSNRIIDQIDSCKNKNTNMLVYSLKNPINNFLHGYWPFHNGIGTNISDYSIYDNYGIIEQVDPNIQSYKWKNHTGSNQDLSIDYNSYLQFINKTCKINITHNESLNFTNKLSLSFWVKLENISSLDKLVEKNGSFSIYQKNGYLQIKLCRVHDQININNITVMLEDTWYFISIRYFKNSIKLWIYDVDNNLVKKEYIIENGIINNTDNPLILGGFSGCIDEVRAYNQYLTDNMIESIWFSPYASLGGIYRILTHELSVYFTIDIRCGNKTDNFTTNDMISFQGSNHSLFYEWNFGDGIIQCGTNVTHQFLKSGFYTIYVNATNPDTKIKTHLEKQVFIKDISEPIFRGIKTIIEGNNSIFLSWDKASDEDFDLTYYCYTRTKNEKYDFNHPNAITKNTSLRIHNLTANISYFFIVRAIDSSGNIEKNIKEVTGIPFDKKCPFFKGLKTVGMVSNKPHSIYLEWDLAEDVSHPLQYHIYISNTSDTFDFNNPLLVTNNSFCIINNVTFGKWFFIIRSVDCWGNEDKNFNMKHINLTNPDFSIDFNYFPIHPYIGNSVTFIDSSFDSNGQIVNWTWVIENNSFYNKNISYTFNHSGIYNVTLNVKNDYNVEKTISKLIMVNHSNLIANFTHVPSYPTENTSIHFYDTSISSDEIINWSWDFYDGKKIYTQHPYYQFSNNGTYPITLTIKNEHNLSDSISINITIYNGIEVCFINQSLIHRGFPIRNAIDGQWSSAQSFSLQPNIIDHIDLLVRKFGIPEFDFIVQLRINSTTGPLLDQHTVSQENISSSWSWITLDFNNTLTKDNTSYFITSIAPPDSVQNSFGYEWGYAFGDHYDNGSFWFTRDGGNLWRELPDLYEFSFKIFGYN